MKLAALIGALLVALLAAGCRSDAPPKRSPAVEKLALLCDTARTDIEAIGDPAEVGYKALEPWAARGKRLVVQVKRLRGATPEEQTQLDELADDLDEYYAGLSLGFTTYSSTFSRDVFAQIIDRAAVFLESAKKRAAALGAPECATQPFE